MRSSRAPIHDMMGFYVYERRALLSTRSSLWWRFIGIQNEFLDGRCERQLVVGGGGVCVGGFSTIDEDEDAVGQHRGFGIKHDTT